MAKSILPDLKSTGKVTRGWLGVSVQDITEDIAKSMKLKDRNGALVADVFTGDPADKAGMKAGDVVTEINGKKIKDTHELLMMIAGFRVGEAVVIKAIRDGQEKVFNITVAERKDQEIAGRQGGNAYGMVVQEITPDIAKHLGLSVKRGVIVVDVQEGSAAEEVGIQPQDIILQINKAKIESMKDYLREIGKAGEKEGILLLIRRGRSNLFVPLKK
jgi:serine protease Do